MIIDKNWFLCVKSDLSNPKEYTQSIAGRWNISSIDHLVLVRHKKELKIINRKDLGKTMSLLFVDSSDWNNIQTNLQNEIENNMLTLFSWFDEESGQNYCFFPKINGEKLRTIAESLWTIDIVDANKGRFRVNGSIVNNTDKLYPLYVLSVIYGKISSRWTALLSLKIQIPIPATHFWVKEFLDNCIHDIQIHGYAIASYCTEQKSGRLYEITTNDYEILTYLKDNDKNLISLEKVATKELSDSVKVLLVSEYLESKDIIWDKNIKLFEVR